MMKSKGDSVMGLGEVINSLEQICLLTNAIFDDYFNYIENGKDIYNLKPLKSSELVRIQSIIENIQSELFNRVFMEIAQKYTNKSNNGDEIAYKFSQFALWLQKSSEYINECNGIWSKIYEAREQLFSDGDDLTKEDLWRYRWVTEKLKDSFIKKILNIKSSIQYIIDLADSISRDEQNVEISQIKCPITGQTCGKSIVRNYGVVFIGLQFSSEYYVTDSFKKIINRVLSSFNLIPFFANEHYEPIHISCEICNKLQQIQIAIFEISDGNPNVMFELGLSCGLSKDVVLLSKNGSDGTKISDISGIHRIQYEDLIECETMLDKYLKDSLILKSDFIKKKEVVS